jgi:hypothetical protein
VYAGEVIRPGYLRRRICRLVVTIPSLVVPARPARSCGISFALVPATQRRDLMAARG